MQFGYFTLSDNHYVDNSRSANRFVADILDEALHAEAVGVGRRVPFRGPPHGGASAPRD